jgi:ankyrin repeat protein
MNHRSLPTRSLTDRPDLEQLKRQAKELLTAFRRGDPAALAEVHAHYRAADPAAFALHDAQLVLARACGFDSWPRLKAFVEGATVRRLVDAVRARDLPAVESLLRARPELARMSVANLGVLHHAVLVPAPEMVRILMAHGANARDGVYPHRDATSAYAIASQRGDTAIVRIIEEEEQKARDARSGLRGAPAAEPLFQAIHADDLTRVVALLDADPTLVRTRQLPHDVTPLHVAAHSHHARIAAALLDRGADVAARGHQGLTPLDAAAHQWWQVEPQRFLDVARLLLARGAPMTAAAAAAMGDTAWLAGQHAAGTLENQVLGSGGLLRIAATHDRSAVLRLLLDAGFDPDERMRLTDEDEPAYSWGMALQHCASRRKYAMATLLLEHGADPNARIYASGDPMFSAYSEQDWEMVALLERFGGVPCATTPGLFRQTGLAKRMLAGEARYRLDGVGGDTLAEQLLWGAACGGDPEIVRLALAHVPWVSDDPRWFTMLEQPLRTWTHGSGSGAWPRDTYLACFRLLLERCDPNLRGRPTDDYQFGLTILHSVAAKDLTPGERTAFATALLDAGARLDLRDNLLRSTPLGWAARWGRLELVRLLLDRGADPVEADAEPWATPRAWAERGGHREVLALL